MSEPNGELTDFPEIDQADMSAHGFEASAEPVADEPAPEADAEGGADEPAVEPEPATEPHGELPAYRREAIAKREQDFQNRIDRLERLIDKQNTPPPAVLAPKAGEELTPEQKAVQGKFFALFPQAKTLFEKADQILRAAEVAPRMADQAQASDDFRAESSLKSAVDRVAVGILGTGKTGANLRPEARTRIARSFAHWAGSDYLDAQGNMRPDTPAEVLQRASRYSAGDPALIDDFASDFLSDFTPVNRAVRVADAKRATAKSPRGGPASAPPPVSPKPPNSDDEDAMHNAAYRSLRAAAAG